MIPFAGLLFEGTSPPPLKVAWIRISSAKACGPVAIRIAEARAARPRRLAAGVR